MGQIQVFVQELMKLMNKGFQLTQIWIVSLQSGLGPQILKVAPISICSLKNMGKNLQKSYGHVRQLQNCPNAGFLHYFSERTRKMGKNASSQRNLFFNLDPTLNSHNFSSKKSQHKKIIKFSESHGRQLSVGIPWIPQKNSSLRKKHLNLHSFGLLWSISTGNRL